MISHDISFSYSPETQLSMMKMNGVSHSMNGVTWGDLLTYHGFIPMAHDGRHVTGVGGR